MFGFVTSKSFKVEGLPPFVVCLKSVVLEPSVTTCKFDSETFKNETKAKYANVFASQEEARKNGQKRPTFFTFLSRSVYVNISFRRCSIAHSSTSVLMIPNHKI